MDDATNRVMAESNRPAAQHARLQENRILSVSPDLDQLLGQQDSEILTRQHFLRQLQLEKRRTDRTKSPLSLVVVKSEPDRGGGFGTLNEVLDLLVRSKRDTDIVAHISKDRAAVLLPHTSAQGVQVFVDNIAMAIGDRPCSISSSTYPDHVFDHILREPTPSSDARMYIVEEEPRQTRASAIAKRVLDVIGSLVAIVVFSPLMLATAIAVAVSSPGPIVFRQTRLGKGGAPFVFYKFRSMRINSDDRLHREYVSNLIEGNLSKINQGDARRPLYKMLVDPRITAVGRFIRKTSLDELPQLVNVLKGDMSLVGPRPPLPYEAEKYQSWHLRRVLEVRPGITGLWQVEGRSTTSFDDMVRLDLRYVRSCSVWLDIRIIAKTVLVLFGSRGAA